MIIALTGHRSESCEPENVVRQKFRTVFRYTEGITAVITGMANGVDLWAGDEARLLGIDLWAAKPWTGHGPRKDDAEIYAEIIGAASQVVNVVDREDFPGNWCYHKRNEWMVDNATHVLAYWNGTESGGTYACRNYAKKVGRPIRNIYWDAPF